MGEPLRRLADLLPTVILTELEVVISAEAGIQFAVLDSRLRGNDGMVLMAYDARLKTQGRASLRWAQPTGNTL